MDLERKHLRLPLASRVFIELDAADAGAAGDDTVAVCTALDVSAQGIRVALDQELQEEAYLQVGVEPPHAEGTAAEPFFLLAQVRWCRPAENSEHNFIAGLALMPAQGSDIEHWTALISSLQD